MPHILRNASLQKVFKKNKFEQIVLKHKTKDGKKV